MVSALSDGRRCVTSRAYVVGGGLSLLALVLVLITALDALGVSLGDALYLSLLAVVAAAYGVTEWRLRQER